jgi:hypothetical protein
VVVSWASPGPAARPRVRIGRRVIAAEARPYTGHLVLGCGGAIDNLDDYGSGGAEGPHPAKVLTAANRPAATSTPGVFHRPVAPGCSSSRWRATASAP